MMLTGQFTNSGTQNRPLKNEKLMSQKHCYILLGGLVGPDGIALAPVENSGMLVLMAELQAQGYDVHTATWDAYLQFLPLIVPGDHKNILIGYSGGGWRAITLANTQPLPHIDLLILIDPSPMWKVDGLAVGDNVKRSLLIHNSLVLGNLGGGKIKTSDVMEVSAPHLMVPELPQVHVRILEMVKAL